MVKVSVVMPVYHTEKFLHDAVASVLNQTHSDLNLIAICDVGQKEVHRILNLFEDDRLEVYTTPAFLNVSVKMNYAKDIVDGKYVARMDSDDICTPDRLEKQMAFLESHPHVDVVGGQLEYINEDGTHNGYQKFPTRYLGILLAMSRYNPVANPTFMMKAETFRKLHYDPTITTGVEDYDYWVRAAKRGVIIRNLPDVVLKYRLKDRSELQTNPFYVRDNRRIEDETRIKSNAQGLLIKNIRNVVKVAA